VSGGVQNGFFFQRRLRLTEWTSVSLCLHGGAERHHLVGVDRHVGVLARQLLHQIAHRGVGPAGYCSPRHRVPNTSRDEEKEEEEAEAEEEEEEEREEREEEEVTRDEGSKCVV